MCCFVGEFGSLSLVMTQDEALHRAPEKLKICYLFSILGIEFNIFNPVAAFTRFVETRLMAAVCLARCGQLPMIAFKTKASVANGIATAFLPSWRLPMTPGHKLPMIHRPSLRRAFQWTAAPPLFLNIVRPLAGIPLLFQSCRKRSILCQNKGQHHQFSSDSPSLETHISSWN